eukprot:Pgem_evm1s6095
MRTDINFLECREWPLSAFEVKKIDLLKIAENIIGLSKIKNGMIKIFPIRS